MAKVLTTWVSPMQSGGPQTVLECCERVRRHTPEGWIPRLLIPALYGPWWQAECRNTCGMEIRPYDANDLGWVKDRFTEQGMDMGAWGVPRFLTYEEGAEHGKAASIVDLYCLDVEPYSEFIQPPFDRCVADFIAGFKAHCDRAPWISLVPQPSGIDTLGTHLWEWLTFSTGVRTQNYWTDSGGVGTSLDYPQPSGAYIARAFAAAGVKRKVVPMFPANGGDHLGELLSKSRSNRDVWVLAS